MIILQSILAKLFKSYVVDQLADSGHSAHVVLFKNADI